MDILPNPYHKKVRIRICGVLVENEHILLVRHQGLGNLGFFWSPPGGGLEFGESVSDALVREFLEETHLEIRIGDFLTFHEHRDDRFHALELFFEVFRVSGEARLGTDPETSGSGPILDDLQYFNRDQLLQLPTAALHSQVPGFLK